jgi:hypothetical protein
LQATEARCVSGDYVRMGDLTPNCSEVYDHEIQRIKEAWGHGSRGDWLNFHHLHASTCKAQGHSWPASLFHGDPSHPSWVGSVDLTLPGGLNECAFCDLIREIERRMLQRTQIPEQEGDLQSCRIGLCYYAGHPLALAFQSSLSSATLSRFCVVYYASGMDPIMRTTSSRRNGILIHASR